MELLTQRLHLRAPESRDAERYAAIYNSEFVLRYNAMTPKPVERLRAMLADPQTRETTVMLEHRETGALLGAICIEEDSLRYGVASRELSYHLAEAYARQGYMKEAMAAVIGHLFETEDLECVAARCFAPNEASHRLLQSLGFHQDGRIPRCVKGYQDVVFDDTLYSLFRKDFA